jgi:hypothetical protein
MDPYPKSHPPVRGGFSPLSTGTWTPRHLSGLGDLCDPSDISCQQTGVTNINLITGNPVDVSGANTLQSLFASIPIGAWLLMGVSAFALIEFSKGGR